MIRASLPRSWLAPPAATLLAALLAWAPATAALAQGAAAADPRRQNVLPAEVVRALKAPEKVTLFSLEPWERPAAGDHSLHRFKVLGQADLDRPRIPAALAEFVSVVSGWDGQVAMCFDPRHALRVTAGGATYDLLLCYECHRLYVYQDDRLVARLGASGSPGALNAMFQDLKLPLSRSAERIASQQQKARTAYEKWMAAMPASIRPLWDGAVGNGLSPKIDVLRPAIAREFPNDRQRILALYGWFGSGAGPWSGYPSYESVAEELLLDHSTEELVAAAGGPQLSPEQLEGAARLLGGWTFSTRRPEDRDSVPAELRKRLLDQALKSGEGYNADRARNAFARTYATPPVSRAAMDLIRASREGNLQAVKRLLEQGAPTDGKDGHGMTALFWAISYGHKAVAQALVENGTPVKGAAGADPLMEAALQGHLDLVRLLLDRGADPNAKGWRGLTPLAAATQERHEKIRELLLKAGARP